MKRLALFISLLLGTSSAISQSLINVEAAGTTTPAGSGNLTTSSWNATYLDANGDNRMQTDEIVYFSGATVWVNDFADFYLYDTLVGTPDIDGISTSSGADSAVPCCWWFTGSKVAEHSGIDGWFPSRWADYSAEPAALPQCDQPISIEEVVNNLESGFDVDPAGPGPFPPIWSASNGTSTRGFIDVERGEIVPVQCETDHIAIYVWFGGSTVANDLIQDVVNFRNLFDVTLSLDGAPVGLMDFTPYIGASPVSLTTRGILKVAAIIEPGDLTPGVHRAILQLRSDTSFNVDLPVTFYITAVTPESLVRTLLESVASLNLAAGSANALRSKLQNALDALAGETPGGIVSAIGMLNAFINSVEAQTGKSISPEQAEELVSQAGLLISKLETS
jgi:hypothetical protein